jgi:HSP20 family protein
MKLARRDQQQTQQGQSRALSVGDSVGSLFPDSLFWDPFRLWNTALNSVQTDVPMNISETDKEVRLEVRIAGYDPKNIRVDVQNNLVTISGKAEQKEEQENESWYQREWSMGEFTRQVRLPDYADGANAVCKCRNGMLTINVPKRPEADRKSLPIQTE